MEKYDKYPWPDNLYLREMDPQYEKALEERQYFKRVNAEAGRQEGVMGDGADRGDTSAA